MSLWHIGSCPRTLHGSIAALGPISSTRSSGQPRERQYAQRKAIEAQGISDFQSIVSRGISDQLLAWKGIEATQQLAHSSNAKIVIIGNPKNGMPLIVPTDQK